MNVNIVIAPIFAPFDISMFSIIITKTPITIFLYVQNGDL